MSGVAAKALGPISAGLGDLVALLGDLVRAHPIYASDGIDLAQSRLAAELGALGAEVAWQEIDQAELERSELYVDVKSFGGVFEDYGRRRRRNLVARLSFGPGGPRVVLNGHVDVEFVTAPSLWRGDDGWRSGRLEGDKLYGRGASDMLGGVACYVHTLRHLVPLLRDARGELELQFVVDEEIGGNGTLWALMNGRAKPDVALIAEPSDALVCAASSGFYQFRVVCYGDPVHMVFAEASDNAIWSMAEVCQCLERLEDWVAARAPAGRRVRSVMYGAAAGGSDAAVPAASAELLVTAALPPALPFDEVLGRLRGFIDERLKGRVKRLPTVEPYGVRFPGSSLSDAGLCERIRRRGALLGSELAVGAFPSPCDARLFEAFGVPAVVFGPGSLARAHGSNEYVTVGELESYCHVLAGTLLELFGVEAGP